jgi:hypothetical protein
MSLFILGVIAVVKTWEWLKRERYAIRHNVPGLSVAHVTAGKGRINARKR